MNSKDKDTAPSAAAARQARLEKQMRENLMKRKALKRARTVPETTTDVDGEAEHPEHMDNMPGSEPSET